MKNLTHNGGVTLWTVSPVANVKEHEHYGSSAVGRTLRCLDEWIVVLLGVFQMKEVATKPCYRHHLCLCCIWSLTWQDCRGHRPACGTRDHWSVENAYRAFAAPVWSEWLCPQCQIIQLFGIKPTALLKSWVCIYKYVYILTCASQKQKTSTFRQKSVTWNTILTRPQEENYRSQ